MTAFTDLVDLGLERSAARGHDMVNEGSSDKPQAESAFYRCKRCAAAFTVGYESGSSQGLQLLAATATTTDCPVSGGMEPDPLPDPHGLF